MPRRAAQSRPRVDVGVVTWNTAELTTRALRVLLDGQQGCDIRVLVHDNASSDDTVSRLARDVPEAEIVVGDVNLGFAGAVNLLLARSDAPWFLALNSDAWPEAGALRTLVDHAEAHPDAAAVAPLLLRPDGSVEHSAHPFPGPGLALLDAVGGRHWLPRRYLERRCLQGSWHHDHTRMIDWAVGAALLLRRRAVEDVGGLDERFFMYAEDLEWCWRARRRGWEVHFQPAAVVRHVGNASGERRFGDGRAAIEVANADLVLRDVRGPVVAAAHRALSTLAAGERFLLARARGDSEASAYWRGQVRAYAGRATAEHLPRPEPTSTATVTEAPSDRPGSPRVTVVVATRNRADLLPRLVSSLAAQTMAPTEVELVVVDDASTDGTRRVLEGLVDTAPVRMRVLGLPARLGPGGARNAGWRAAHAPVVAFTDDDCVPAPDWLASGLAALGGRRAVVLGRTEPSPDQRALAARPFSRTIEVHSPRYFETCNAFYRRADLEAVGGFDERFGVAGEDTDLGLRTCARGVAPVFAPDALVHHDVQPGSLADALRNTARFADIAMVLRRHPGARRSLLHRRVFWKRTHPTAVLAGAGLVLAPWQPPALFLLMPWVHHRVRTTPACPGPLRRVAVLPGALTLDLFEVATMVRSSIKHRTVLL